MNCQQASPAAAASAATPKTFSSGANFMLTAAQPVVEQQIYNKLVNGDITEQQAKLLAGVWGIPTRG